MLIKTLPVGQLETNCYVVTDENALVCAVIDPGDESNTILDYIEDNKLSCKAILITHAHFDHVSAVNAMLEATGAELYMCEKDLELAKTGASGRFTPPENTHFYKDGDEV
ncbi:MAG: MBL fold metallo-hydrolase, partial [Firmicutes bacterium]|nr:MBL fold metallo-hydrolase [Bacillota bacterium]